MIILTGLLNIKDNIMRNYKGIFYRTDELSREPDQCSDWIDLLATKVKIDAEKIATASSKTAVEVARDRNRQPSIYEMMSSIVSGQKPKFSSVEEAVQDYQRRTGLAEYLKRAGTDDLSILASQIITNAAHGVCPKCGCSFAECECDNSDVDDDKDEEEEDETEDESDEDESETEEEEDSDKEEEEEEEEEDTDDSVDFFRKNLDYGEVEDKKIDWRDFFKTEIKNSDVKEPEDEVDNDPYLMDPYWMLEEDDKEDARDMTEEELKANPGKKKLISEAETEDERPELLVKNPSVEHFLTNLIDTNIGIQVPAILHSLLETFSRDGIDHQIFSDRPLLDWINKKLISKGIIRNDAPSHIGRGVGTHIEYSGDKDSNKDPFTLLVPDKGA
jgi:hypothetical protein